jgi:hypothetical protein
LSFGPTCSSVELLPGGGDINATDAVSAGAATLGQWSGPARRVAIDNKLISAAEFRSQ